MIKKYDTRIKNGDNDGELHVHYRLTQKSQQPIIIFASGFSVDGTESHRMFMNVADKYNDLGYSTVLFDYKGCGYSDGDFRDFNITSAYKDLLSVVSWAKSTFTIGNSKIIIHAQSLGTSIATIAFHNSNDIHRFIFWNLSANLSQRYIKILGEDILSQNEICIKSKGLYVKSSFLEEMNKYDILEYLNNSDKAILFLNSGDDSVGDPLLSEIAYKRNKNSLTKRVIVNKANHSFKCQFELEKEAIQYSIDWLKNVL